MSLIYEGGHASPVGNVPPSVGAGTNLLQVSIDENTRALGNLSSQFAAFKNSGGYTDGGMLAAKTWASRFQGPSYAGFPAMQSPANFAVMGPTATRPGTMIAPYGTGGSPAYSGASQNWGWGAGNAGYSPGQYTALGGVGGVTPFNGARQNGNNQWNYSATVGPAPRGVGGGPTTQNQGMSTVGAGSGPPAAPPNVNNPFRTAAIIGGTLGAVGAAAVMFGKSQLADQVVANQYTVNAQVASPVGQPFSQTNTLARFQAFGVGGRNLNAAATSYQDAAQGQAAIGYISGNVPGSVMNASGRAVQGATNATAFFNPGLGYNGAAQLAGTIYSPQMSAQMQALGYSSTPRKIGGGNMQGTGQYVQSLLQGWYGSNSVSQKNLLATLSQGGIGTYNLQSLGYSSSQISQMTPVLEGYNKLFNQGVSANQANKLFNQATHGTRGSMADAQYTLEHTYGLPQSDIQALKDKKAVSTNTSSDIADAFNTTLKGTVSLLGRFNQWLNTIMHATHTTNLIGGAGGIGGALSTVGGIGGGALGLLGLRSLFAGGGAAAVRGAGGAVIRGAGGALDGMAMGGARGAGAAWRGVSGLFDGAGAGGAAGGVGDLVGGGLSAVALVALLGNALRVNGGLLPGTRNSPEFNARFGPTQTDGRPGGASGAVNNAKSSQAVPKGGKQSTGGGVSHAAQVAAQDAVTKVGDPYLWGGTGPNAFDCSGLVQWAYHQAGVNLDRTSQAQAVQLAHRMVNKNDVQEGDIIFKAGSDGTNAAPGHEALMISRNRYVEAQQTGVPIHIKSYNPGDWVMAARPTGSLNGQGSTGIGGPGGHNGGSSNGNTLPQGNAGAGSLMGSGVGFGADEATTLSSTDESSMLAGGFIGGGGGVSGGTNTTGSGPGSNGGKSTGGFGGITGGGTIAKNKSLMKQLAARKGWGPGSAQWNALDWLVMHESGYNNHIWNTAGSGAYGIAQALPASKYPKAGRPESMGGHSDAKAQEVWMLDYIAGRYKTPRDAKAFHLAHNSYATGGRPGKGEYGLVGERGPEMVKFGEGGHVIDAAKTSDLLNGMSAMVKQVGSSPSHTTGGRGTINLNFGENSITISQCGHGHDQGDAARIFMRALKKHLRNEDIYAAIAEGDKF